jgi:hypothetical protein
MKSQWYPQLAAMRAIVGVRECATTRPDATPPAASLARSGSTLISCLSAAIPFGWLHDFGDRLYMRDAFSKQTGKRSKTQQALPNNPGLVKHAPNLRVCRAHMKPQRSRSTLDQQEPASR